MEDKKSDNSKVKKCIISKQEIDEGDELMLEIDDVQCYVDGPTLHGYLKVQLHNEGKILIGFKVPHTQLNSYSIYMGQT
jgi:hypothetical protein